MMDSPAQGFSKQSLLSVLHTLPSPAAYWIAYSGGLDSSVLLHAMAALRDHLAVDVRALHLDHGLHPDSSSWSQHCRDTCERLTIPFAHQALHLKLQTGASVEAEARDARLAAFRQVLEPGQLLLTAQHRDDQAETLLLQLLRGSGLDGLAAMPRLSPLGVGRMARPLLDFSRAELRAYAEAKHIAWIEDPSNAQWHFDRNYLRHRVLPLMAERWPSYAATLSRSAAHCAEARHVLDELGRPQFQTVQGNRPGTLNIDALLVQSPALCRELLRRWIRERGFALPDRVRLERILSEVLTAAPDRNPIVEWPGAQVRRYRNELFLLRPLPSIPQDLVLPWREGDTLRLPQGLGTLTLDKAPTVWEIGKSEKLSVRFGVTGLRCRPGKNRPSRPLKHLYQERGVPEWIRPYVPLLFFGEQLKAVAGIWRCEDGSPLDEPAWQLDWTGHPFSDFFYQRNL